MESLLLRENDEMTFKFLQVCKDVQCRYNLYQSMHILQYAFLFPFFSALVVVSYNSADLTMVEVLQPANLSHPSLVFGTCADVYPSIKDVRQENVVDLMLRQHRQPIICLFFP